MTLKNVKMIFSDTGKETNELILAVGDKMLKRIESKVEYSDLMILLDTYKDVYIELDKSLNHKIDKTIDMRSSYNSYTVAKATKHPFYSIKDHYKALT